MPTTEGHPQRRGTIVGTGRPGGSGGRGAGGGSGAGGDGLASGVLVGPSLLLTSRDVAATVAEARGLTLGLAQPERAAGHRLVLEPDDAFVTSPALGWTLVRVEDRGLPVLRLRRLAGLALPPVSCGVRARGGLRWVEGDRIVADVDLRLRVLGGRGQVLRRELGL